jgi:DNA-binding response OmpR family regulator
MAQDTEAIPTMANILIIDDDPLIGESLSTVIRKMGHSARWARTVREAVERVDAEAFDLL